MGECANYPSLSGRCVFITGGATGIGAAMVEAFALQDSKVAFVDLDLAAAQTLCDRLESEIGVRPWFQQVDVTDSSALQGSIKQAVDDLGPLQALVKMPLTIVVILLQK